MSLRRSLVRGALLLTIVQALGQLLSFIRTIIVARMLSPTDLGIGATLWITVAFLQMLSDFSADKLIIQAREGDDPRLEDTAHFWQILRGIACGAVLFIAAWPVSALFRAPQALGTFQAMAIVPVLRGFWHLDLKRLQRDLHYTPQVTAEFCSLLLSLLATWPLASLLGDYRVILGIAVVQDGSLAIVSQIVATRRYRWAWDPHFARRLVAFGWPLVINGVLMFAILQGDRLLVGTLYSMHDLGVYSVAVLLTSAPTAMLASIATSLMLPLLSSVQGNNVAFATRYVLSAQLLGLVAGLMAVPFILAGDYVLSLLYGAEYSGAATVIGWLAAAQAVRLLRVAPQSAGIAQSDTRNPLLANCGRATALPLALAFAQHRLSLAWVSAAGLVGEIAALLLSVYRLSRRKAPKSALNPAGPLAVVLCASVALAVAVRGASACTVSVITGVTVIGSTILTLAVATELRLETRRLVVRLWFRSTMPSAT